MARNPDAYQVTVDEVRDAVVDQQHLMHKRPSDELQPVDVHTIAEHILGYDPVDKQLVRPGFHGHVGKDAQINKVLSMSTLRKALDQLVDDGVLVKVRKPAYPANGTKEGQRLSNAVRFYYRLSGYVTAEALAAAYDRLDAAERNRQRDAIMQAARDGIADKYMTQVMASYRKVCASRGLDPEREGDDAT